MRSKSRGYEDVFGKFSKRAESPKFSKAEKKAEEQFGALYLELIKKIHPDNFSSGYSESVTKEANRYTRILNEINSTPIGFGEGEISSWREKLEALKAGIEPIDLFINSLVAERIDLPALRKPDFINNKKFREKYGRFFSGFSPDKSGRLFYLKSYNETKGEVTGQVSFNTEEGSNLAPFHLSLGDFERLAQKEVSFNDLLGAMDAIPPEIPGEGEEMHESNSEVQNQENENSSAIPEAGKAGSPEPEAEKVKDETISPQEKIIYQLVEDAIEREKEILGEGRKSDTKDWFAGQLKNKGIEDEKLLDEAWELLGKGLEMLRADVRREKMRERRKMIDGLIKEISRGFSSGIIRTKEEALDKFKKQLEEIKTNPDVIEKVSATLARKLDKIQQGFERLKNESRGLLDDLEWKYEMRRLGFQKSLKERYGKLNKDELKLELERVNKGVADSAVGKWNLNTEAKEIFAGLQAFDLAFADNFKKSFLNSVLQNEVKPEIELLEALIIERVGATGEEKIKRAKELGDKMVGMYGAYTIWQAGLINPENFELLQDRIDEVSEFLKTETGKVSEVSKDINGSLEQSINAGKSEEEILKPLLGAIDRSKAAIEKYLADITEPKPWNFKPGGPGFAEIKRPGGELKERDLVKEKEELIKEIKKESEELYRYYKSEDIGEAMPGLPTANLAIKDAERAIEYFESCKGAEYGRWQWMPILRYGEDKLTKLRKLFEALENSGQESQTRDFIDECLSLYKSRLARLEEIKNQRQAAGEEQPDNSGREGEKTDSGEGKKELTPQEKKRIKLYEDDARQMVKKIRGLNYTDQYGYDPADVPGQIEIFTRRYFRTLRKEMIEEGLFKDEERINLAIKKLKEKVHI